MPLRHSRQAERVQHASTPTNSPMPTMPVSVNKAKKALCWMYGRAFSSGRSVVRSDR